MEIDLEFKERSKRFWEEQDAAIKAMLQRQSDERKAEYDRGYADGLSANAAAIVEITASEWKAYIDASVAEIAALYDARHGKTIVPHDIGK